jgi:outer membrane protein, heavy metal efflux system
MGKLPAAVVSCALLVGCAGARHLDREDLLRTAEGRGPASAPATPGDLGADESSLAAAARLEVLERLSLGRNAELAEQRARVDASAARVDAAGRMPEPEIKYEQWGVPLARPWGLGDANAVMVGVRQSIPAPGTLAAEARAAEAEARIAGGALATRRLDVLRDVRRAYLDYLLADREYSVHVNHGDLTQKLDELARANFRAGRAREQDILRLGVELTRVHAALSSLAQRRRADAVMLNTLAGRDPDAPLGPPAAVGAEEVTAPLAELERAAAARPEVTGAGQAVARAEAQRDGASAAASRPSFMLGLDYMYMPGMMDPHGYGAMVSMSLPWLASGRRAAARAADAQVVAERRGVATVLATVRQQVADAHARYQAARERYLIIDRHLVPQARRALEAAHASYAAGGGDALSLVDALRAYLDVRLDRERVLVELEGSIAELERAVGGEVARRPLTDDTTGGSTP